MFDAHADFNTATLTPSGHIPAVNPKDSRQIGIHIVDEGEKRMVHDTDIEVFNMRYLDAMGMRHAMELALALLGPDTQEWLREIGHPDK